MSDESDLEDAAIEVATCSASYNNRVEEITNNLVAALERAARNSLAGAVQK